MQSKVMIKYVNAQNKTDFIRALSEHMFKIYDTDGNGVIDFKEFMTLYFMMSEGSPEEILSGIFRMFDDNGDGTITTDEMDKVASLVFCSPVKDFLISFRL